MIDVVYVLGTGSRFKNHEIRFSLRSVEKHLQNVGNIWIVGEHHPQLTGVNFIPYPDKTKYPASNIMYKITRACEDQAISDNFLFVNDDHYLLQDFDAETFPYYYNGTIKEFIRMRGADQYTKQVGNTLKYLESKGLPTKFFDVHYPIIFNKFQFLDSVTPAIDWHTSPCVVKSLYANSLKIEGIKECDFKTDKAPPKSAKVFSTGTRVTSAIQRFLLEQFPNKSRYELRDF